LFLKIKKEDKNQMKTEIFNILKKAVLDYDNELAVETAQKVIEHDLDPLEAFDVMASAVKEVGDAFEKKQLWLPDLLGAGEAMSSAMSVLEDKVKEQGKKSNRLGTVVIGTVQGDIHSIGKDMVASLLVAEGFEVHDLGVNVKPDQFIKAVKEYDANVVAMSALLTVTAPEQRKVIEMLVGEQVRDNVKVIVGGGAISQEFADSIGADGYDSSAPGAVKLARSLVEGRGI